MITVRVWSSQRTGFNVGHASAMIGKTYVSWWPTEGNDWKQPAPGGANPDVASDITGEGGKRPQRVFNLNGLDERAAVQWWKRFLTGPNANYSATGQNCSWAVMQVLKEAGGDQYASYATAGNWSGAYPGSYANGANYGYCAGLLVRGMATAGVNKVRTGTFAPTGRMTVNYGDYCKSTWTPEDVARYCEELARAMA